MAETGTDTLLSVVVPVYNEAENILPLLERLRAELKSPHEALLVYDFDDDTTLPPAREFSKEYPAMRLVRNSIGPGALNALKTGLSEAKGDAIVVTMADMSDDLGQIERMTGLIAQGHSVVAPSRYMRGGAQEGGPPVKGFLSRLAGVSLNLLTGVGTHDSTNNFKAYSRELIDQVEIESGSGFELGLELTVKAYLSGHSIVELPTTWKDRTAGESRFKVLTWMPGYLRWYFACIIGSWTGKARRSRRARRGS